jgi:cell wall assembly regulator SMI1
MSAPISVWQRLQNRWEALCPQLPRGGLNPPATERQIAAVEELIGLKLPDDVREAYLHFNGMQAEAFSWDSKISIPRVFLGKSHWIDLECLVTDWTEQRSSEASFDYGHSHDPADEFEGEPIRQRFFHAGWIPVGQLDGGSQVCVDMAPTACGQLGQIFSRDPHSDPMRPMASGFKACVELTLNALDEGRVVWGEQEFKTAGGDRAWYRHPAWQKI